MGGGVIGGGSSGGGAEIGCGRRKAGVPVEIVCRLGSPPDSVLPSTTAFAATTFCLCRWRLCRLAERLAELR